MPTDTPSAAPPTSTTDARDAAERDARATSDRTLGLPIVLAVGLVAMLVWPAVAAAAAVATSALEAPFEWLLVFGGVTALVMTPLAFLVEITTTVYGIVIAIVWLAAWLLPPWLRARRLRRARAAGALATTRVLPAIIIWVAQSGFSLLQASLGALMILGKNV